MSAKRAATSELNHDNWDQEDPSEHEEMGTFKSASKDILEKRVIRTAKRRSQLSSEDGKKGVFSGFGGFNKTQPSSFDFLSNLTNGNKDSNAPVNKNEAAVSSSLFSNKALSSSPGGGLFSPQPNTANTASTKATFGIPTQSSPIFGISSPSMQTGTSVFTASKADSTVGDSPFKSQPTSSTTKIGTPESTKTTSSNTLGSQVTSSLFGVTSSNASTGKPLFSNTNNSTMFKVQPVSSSTTIQSNFGTTSTTVANPSLAQNNKETPADDNKLKYYAKLKGLNESVSDWIKKHVEETPLCILSPIFKDYEKYLKEIQEEYDVSDSEKDNSNKSVNQSVETKVNNEPEKKSTSLSPFNNTSSSAKSDTSNAKSSLFGIQSSPNKSGEKPTFSFGINPSASNTLSKTSTTNAGFSFGISTSQTTSTTSSLFSTTNANTNGAPAPFSFGTGKPFSFSSNIQTPPSEVKENGNEEDDEPPKVEYTPVVEENSVYDKKCKIFVKKDGNFVDKGVGTLYIKKIEESGKHQLLVRANTSLGNVLLNLILASAIPTQRMGKNNVMIVCIPTPEAKPPPVPILIRVKTSEEADEMLEILDKYKS